MVTMDDLSKAIILLVRVGAVARFIYCMVRLAAAEEQAAQYKKRARNTVIFYVIAESIWADQRPDFVLLLVGGANGRGLETLYPSGCEAGGGAVHRLWEKAALSGVDWFPGDGGVAALVWLFTANVTTTVVLALAGIFGSVMMTTKDQSNLSVVDQVQNLVRFLRGQKIYPYRYGDEWGLE